MKSTICISLFAISLLIALPGCGGAQRREMRARERERKHQESKDQLDRDKRNFEKTFDSPSKED